MSEAIAGSISSEAFRAAMARLPSAVHIVTTDGADGWAGFTASSVCSVSDTPPMLLVCINRAASAHPAFNDSEFLCVNTLAAGQQDVAGAFGGKTTMAARFETSTWHRKATGAPVLEGALVSFECRIKTRVSVETHDVLFCEVVALCSGTGGGGLIYAQRRFRALVDDGEQNVPHQSSGPVATSQRHAATAVA